MVYKMCLCVVSQRPVYSHQWCYWSLILSLSTATQYSQHSTTFDCVCHCHWLVMCLVLYNHHWMQWSTALSPSTGICPSVCLCVRLPVCLSVSVRMSVRLSVCVSVCPSVCHWLVTSLILYSHHWLQGSTALSPSTGICPSVCQHRKTEWNK